MMRGGIAADHDGFELKVQLTATHSTGGLRAAPGDPMLFRCCWLTDTVGPCRPNWWGSAR
jgi:hypothetical protein